MAAVAAIAAARARTNRGCGLWPVAAVAGGQERPRHGPHCLQNPGTSCQSISALVTNAAQVTRSELSSAPSMSNNCANLPHTSQHSVSKSDPECTCDRNC